MDVAFHDSESAQLTEPDHKIMTTIFESKYLFHLNSEFHATQTGRQSSVNWINKEEKTWLD